MNPPIPLTLLLTIAVPLLLLFGFLSWRATASLGRGQRLLLSTLRVAGIIGLVVLLTNPGQWVQPVDVRKSPWLLLVDRSSSMTQALSAGTRSDLAKALARQTVERAEQQDIPLEIRCFDSTAGEEISMDGLAAANGRASDLAGSLNQLLAASAASGKSYSGVIALSDGRQTRTPDDLELASLILRLNSYRTAFHGVVIGHGQAAKDLALSATRPSLTGFAGQNLRIPFVLQSRDLNPLKPEVRLLDAEGLELATISLAIADGETIAGAFEIPCPEASTRLEIVTELIEGEVIAANNRDSLRIQVLDSKTRVFLAEGAPYWDSKFLAQLLRQQSHIELQSVHRIAEDRYFQINSGEQDGKEGDRSIFPHTLEELSQYDLIVFGKNTDAFLDPATTSALRTYVRDRGGAVLFSRGKPTTARHPGLEPLEPVTWNSGLLQDFRFQPSQDGAAAGLFGEALPAIDDSIWSKLPPLKDARTVSTVKPFSRILAHASSDRDQALLQTTPALIVRRYGQGVTGLMNGDGMWKWDFYPEARELGNMYEDFWVQLIQWMASYSEFMPGHDYALRLSPATCLPGASTVITASYRGQEPSPDLQIELIAPDGESRMIHPARLPERDSQEQWRASFIPDRPGSWTTRIVDARPEPGPKTSAALEVKAPPTEDDNLSADDSLMRELAAASEGRLAEADTYAALLESELTTVTSSTATRGAVWRSSWPKWPIALLLLIPYALEWFLRRRQGLA